MDKWDYIKLISERDNRYGYLLLKMMDGYNKGNLQEITYNEAKTFYEEIVKD